MENIFQNYHIGQFFKEISNFYMDRENNSSILNSIYFSFIETISSHFSTILTIFNNY